MIRRSVSKEYDSWSRQIGSSKSLLYYEPSFGQISPFILSGSVKALIMMLKTDYQMWATSCGDNCAKWILRIAEEKEKQWEELEICLEHYMDFRAEDDEIYDFPFFCLDTNKVEDSYEEYTSTYDPIWD